jgi:hypothetical protein
LGKREKSLFLYQDINLDNIALELEFDLYEDKTKHSPQSHLLDSDSMDFRRTNFRENISDEYLNYNNYNNGAREEVGDNMLVRINDSSNFFANIDQVTLKPKFEQFVRLELQESEAPKLKDEKVIQIDNKRFRSIKGSLYEIVDDIEEAELNGL